MVQSSVISYKSRSERQEANLTSHTCLRIPFSSNEFASLAYDVLSVDKELKRSGVQRTIENEGTNLIINFYGEELKRLRVAVNALMKNVKLIVNTKNQFQSV